MRLIIDIPEERYENIKEEQWMPNRLLIEKAIANGIPLEQIRAEIEQIKPYELPWDKRTPEHIRDMAVEIVEKYAEQEPKTGHWIPVSERLPEKTGLHLVSIGDLVTTANFDGHNFRTQGMIRFIPDAWMPLPNPYEPQESEDKE